MSKEELALFGGPRSVPDGMVRPWPDIRQEDKDAVMAVLDRGVLWGAAAPEATKLQEEWAAWLGRKYCLATNSGTAALHMAVAAAGVEPGDEVITTPVSWTSTATCILHHNAIPVFADIDPTTMNIDPKRVEEKITDRTKAIIPVHLFGLAADMDPIMALADKHGLMVIEDACQAHGALYNGKQAGTIGQLAAFSLNGSKNLSAGEGGLFVTDDEYLWQEAARLQQFGEKRRTDGAREYNAYGMGWMYRTTEMSAAFARSQLRRLDEYNERIRENAHHLTGLLSTLKGIRTPVEPEGYKHNYFFYKVQYWPEDLGLDVPISHFASKVNAALQAEGVVLGRGEFVIPTMTLFQEKRGYGKGCPWTCGHYGREIVYRAEDYPCAVEAVERVIGLVGTKPPNGKQLMERYARAFEKVFGALDRVLQPDAVVARAG